MLSRISKIADSALSAVTRKTQARVTFKISANYHNKAVKNRGLGRAKRGSSVLLMRPFLVFFSIFFAKNWQLIRLATILATTLIKNISRRRKPQAHMYAASVHRSTASSTKACWLRTSHSCIVHRLFLGAPFSSFGISFQQKMQKKIVPGPPGVRKPSQRV